LSKSLKLFQHKDGFRYTSDTMFLYDFISHFGLRGRVLDAGAGCGVLGFLLARDFGIELTSVEILHTSYELCIKNAGENGIKANIINGDLLEFEAEKFDYIVSNPPFYHDDHTKSECEKMQSARYSQAMPLDGFLRSAKKLLKPKGELLFCFDARRLVELFEALKATKTLKPISMQFVHAKPQTSSKLVLIRAKMDSKSAMEILPPIYANEGNTYSPQAQEIFTKANCESIDVI